MSQQPSNLTELLEQSCGAFASRPLFGERARSGWAWVTYAEFQRRVDELRGGFASLGLGPGDRIGIVADNCLQWMLASFATYTLGAIFVPMYTAQSAREWEFILRDCDAQAVLAGNARIGAELEAIRPRLGSLRAVVDLQGSEQQPHSFTALVRRGLAEPRSAETPAADTPATFIYTSGTTGQPKGVVLSHGNIVSEVVAVRRVFPLTEEDRSLAFLPWAHALGQVGEVLSVLSMGGSVAINDDLSRLLDNLREVRPTLLVGVPRVYNRLHDGVRRQLGARPAAVQRLFNEGLSAAMDRSRGQTLGLWRSLAWAAADRLLFARVRDKLGGRLRYAICGSAALSQEVAEFISGLGILVLEGYGLTETSPVISINTPSDHRMGSVGRPLPGIELRIEPDSNDEPGTGEILVRGPIVMQGYHRRPDETRAALCSAGWLHTGDKGRIDTDGYLYVCGRLKEQYKLENGKYVAPGPLEEQLKRSPFIGNVLVYGANRPHNVALVVLDEPAVTEWARARGLTSAKLTEQEPVRELIAGELRQYASGFKSYERPQGFIMTLDDFSIDNGMLTPTLKLKRRNVLAKYESALVALYAPSGSALPHERR
ncbi:MAG: long-chain fatty acid--CoA ligase [Polyangiaceae bacterium]|nr:long-chain fatty acid--CoA ligase [Polyangiaceae bacterium]